MATWLAADQPDFNGARAVASGWFRARQRLLEPLEPGPDHGWLAFHEGYFAHARATPRGARQPQPRQSSGDDSRSRTSEMLGLALEGGALVPAR